MNKEFKPTFLYIKTHNKTGLKYFGKTTNQDPYKYKGSGTHWKRHIKKYGNDVTTEIIGLFTDKIWCMLYALEFSESNDIISSNEWANLKPENGSDGFSCGNQYGGDSESWSNERILKHRIGASKAGIAARDMQVGIFGLTPEQKILRGLIIGKSLKNNKSSRFIELNVDQKFIENKKKTFKEIGHQQGDKNSQFGTCWIYNELIGNKKIDSKLLAEFIDQGWIKGRKMKNNITNTINVLNGAGGET